MYFPSAWGYRFSLLALPSGILEKSENTSAICKEMTKNFITSGKIKVDHLNLHHAYLYDLYKENKKKIS